MLQPPRRVCVDDRGSGRLWRGFDAWFVGECVAHPRHSDELYSGRVGVEVRECIVQALRWLAKARTIVVLADDDEHRGLPALYEVTSACDEVEALRDRERPRGPRVGRAQLPAIAVTAGQS